MVFKRPGNSRDDKSSRSPKRQTKGDEQSKKGNVFSNKKSSDSGSEKTGDRPVRKTYGEKAGSKPGSTSPARRKPYTGRPETSDSPARRLSGDSAFYRGDEGGSKTGGAPARRKPYSGRPESGDSPVRRPSSASGAPNRGRSEDRPKRSFGSETTGEKKFGAKPATRSGEKPAAKRFSDGPAKPGGFKKRGDSPDYKPFRKSENSSYNKPSFKTERDPDAKPRTRKKTSEKNDSGLIRLNRYISNAGICSRRKADELISAGVVSVNGEVISELGYKVDPMKDSVRYNGELLKREKMVYVLLNKPKDYITTTDDPQERRTVMHLVEKASRERIYPIGRLDRNTTGLLLMTNDGDLADKLSHPKNNIVKLYHVELNKNLTQGDLNKIGVGLELEDGFIQPDSVAYVQGGTKREVGIQIHSGKNRIVRRIFEYLGYEVVKLDRAVYANLTKKDLPRGRWRYLEEKEVIQLKHLI